MVRRRTLGKKYGFQRLCFDFCCFFSVSNVNRDGRIRENKSTVASTVFKIYGAIHDQLSGVQHDFLPYDPEVMPMVPPACVDGLARTKGHEEHDLGTLNMTWQRQSRDDDCDKDRNRCEEVDSLHNAGTAVGTDTGSAVTLETRPLVHVRM